MPRDRTSHVPQRWEWIYGENGELVATDPGARVNRIYTAAQLAQMNPMLINGQMIQEKDTGALKIGDGNVRWNDLPYFVGAVAGLSDEQLSEALDAKGLLTQEDADAAYAPRSSVVGEYDYDSNGNVIATPDGTTYTWESDGTGGYRVATETVDGTTRTFTYNSDGTLGSVA